MREKRDNPLVPGPDNMVDALKLLNQAPRVSGQLLASNGPVVDSRDLNLVFGHTEATPNKLFLSSPTKYTVEPFCPLVLVWPPFELLHCTLTTIIFAQYCRMGSISQPQLPSV
ncbi:hypothetical protein TNCV_1241331 [Trichonephila clavipes]|uniref:Uncharacterized protein n=1 Tax=Trichonephila clavipes TaxID=2585209 RepID=A0A8X6WE82_TRICX|nr:hypothetical protein TNCV_1241331 [Trichonephila clavipes]